MAQTPRPLGIPEIMVGRHSSVTANKSGIMACWAYKSFVQLSSKLSLSEMHAVADEV